MKQYFILTALACISFVGYSQLQPSTSGAIISVDKIVHDYGNIEAGSDGTCAFTVVNEGTDPLLLSNCQGSCGCTVPFCQKSPIMPGDSTKIEVRYDTNRIGPINKSVTISSNSVNEPTKVLRITGRVTAPVSTTEGTEE